MNSTLIREPKIDEILESIKVFLLSFGRKDFDNILAENKTWVYLVNKKIAKFLIAEEEDKIIGVGGLFLFQQVASVGYMGVLADYRGKGIGTVIFRNLMDIALNSGIKTVVLYASKYGKPIYEKYGFRGKYNASMHHLVKIKPEKQEIVKDVQIIKTTPEWILELDKETMGFDRSDYIKARVTLGVKILVVENEGYALLSNILSKIRLGPVIAKNVDTAIQIIKKGINLGADNLIIPYHPQHQNLISNITHITENIEIPNLKMIYGDEVQEKLTYLHSIGTYAKG
ncbi:MAG: GNAT family N-acetyltransferase [Promethearchaeota archaeon]|jgi:N-acetylglutamate synthase-like GNAT family acetyltransferase